MWDFKPLTAKSKELEAPILGLFKWNYQLILSTCTVERNKNPLFKHTDFPSTQEASRKEAECPFQTNRFSIRTRSKCNGAS